MRGKRDKVGRTFQASRFQTDGFIGNLDEPLSETIQQALRDARKISSLYLHQAAAINAIANKSHVIVSTSTASGKSVIYQVFGCVRETLLRFNT